MVFVMETVHHVRLSRMSSVASRALKVKVMLRLLLFHQVSWRFCMHHFICYSMWKLIALVLPAK